MKHTVLKASKERAAEVSADLLSRKSKRGKTLFKRYEMSNGFEIRYKTSATEEAVAFKYVNDNERIEFFYEEKLLTFY